MSRSDDKKSTSASGFSEIKSSAKLLEVVAPATELDIAECLTNINTKGGLSASQICLAVQNLDIPNASKKSYSATSEMSTIPYDVYTNVNEKIVVIGNILNLSDNLVENSINAKQFISVVDDINKKKLDPVDSMQTIIAINEKGRKHYVQLEIFKKDDNTIGARIIDSTSNPVAIPVKKVRDLLVNAGVSAKLHDTFGLPKATYSSKKSKPLVTVSVTEVHTGIQSVIGDKRCALYTLGGIAASMKIMFAKGAKHSASDAERTAKAEHSCVKKSLPENYLQSRLVPTVFEKRRATYETLSNAIDAMNKNELNTAVKDSLKNYLKNRGKFGSIFRQLSSVGADYALNAKNRIDGTRTVDDEPVVSKQIAMEILAQSMKADGTIEVKQNSRVHYLLLELKNQNLITQDIVAGSIYNVDGLFKSATSTSDTSFKTLSN